MAVRRRRVVKTNIRQALTPPVKDVVRGGTFGDYCAMMGMGDVDLLPTDNDIPVFYRPSSYRGSQLVSTMSRAYPAFNGKPTMITPRKGLLPAWARLHPANVAHRLHIANTLQNLPPADEALGFHDPNAGAVYSLCVAHYDNVIGLAISRHDWFELRKVAAHALFFAIHPGYEQLVTIIGASPYVRRVYQLALQYLNDMREQFPNQEWSTQALDEITK